MLTKKNQESSGFFCLKEWLNLPTKYIIIFENWPWFWIPTFVFSDSKLTLNFISFHFLNSVSQNHINLLDKEPGTAQTEVYLLYSSINFDRSVVRFLLLESLQVSYIFSIKLDLSLSYFLWSFFVSLFTIKCLLKLKFYILYALKENT